MYNVHRTRVVQVEPVVDNKLQVYDFLENQTWKLHRQQSEALKLLKNNELIYSRINKVETSDSYVLQEQREHLRKITVGTQHMSRLKKIARDRKVDRIQRENMFIKERLNHVKPYYSKKLFDNAYEHHLTFVRGRCVLNII
jgi:hypothetical protein